MRGMSGCLLVLTCAGVVLGVGSILPHLVFAGEGVGSYSGEKEAFARSALVYDLVLRAWPFPVDPTVARRVTEVGGTHDRDSQCTSGKVPKGRAPTVPVTTPGTTGRRWFTTGLSSSRPERMSLTATGPRRIPSFCPGMSTASC